MKAPGIGMVGLGAWGKNHCRVLGELGVLVAAYDSDAERLKDRVGAGIARPSFEALLADPKVDAVVIATPARTHFEMAKAALLADKDVLVEKPLTLVEAEGNALVELAKGAGRILMVGHITLYHPAVMALKALIERGDLGTLRYLYANRLNLGTVREEEDILWSFAPHDIAVFLHLVDRWPTSVSAHGGSYLRKGRADVTVTHLKFEDGVRAHIYVSWLHPFKEHRLVVIGDRGMAVFSDGPGGGELEFFDQVPPMEGEPRIPRRAGEKVAFESAEPLRCELEHFIECIGSRQESRTCGAHGRDVLRILEAAQSSLEEGGSPIPCPALPATEGGVRTSLEQRSDGD